MNSSKAVVQPPCEVKLVTRHVEGPLRPLGFASTLKFIVQPCRGSTAEKARPSHRESSMGSLLTGGIESEVRHGMEEVRKELGQVREEGRVMFKRGILECQNKLLKRSF